MPLIHSKRPAAFKHNIKVEEEAGKPQKQAVAIAYKEAGEGIAHMAKGGPVEANPEEAKKIQDGFNSALGFGSPSTPPVKKADGGEVTEADEAAPEAADQELDEVMGGELMQALESKNPKQLMSAIEAIVLSMMGKE